MTGRTSVDGRTAGRVPRDVRRYVDVSQFHDEVGGIKAFVATQRDGLRPVATRLDHIERSQSLRVARDTRQARIDTETTAVRRHAPSFPERDALAHQEA